MGYPTKLDREKEPLAEVLFLILDKENYKKQENGDLTMKVAFKTEGKANYAKRRLYALLKVVKKDFEDNNLTPPERPIIRKIGGVLEFCFPINRGVEWKVID